MTIDAEDLHAVAALTASFAILLDEGRFPEVASLFAQDARLHRADGSVVTGREEIRRAQSARHAHVTTIHHVSLPFVEPATDFPYQLRGRSNFVAVTVDNRDGSSPGQVIGYFEDRFVRTEDGWKFAERRIRPVYRQLPTHVRSAS